MVGRCTRMLSRYHSYAGEGAPAWETGLAAVAILEPLGESIELARAYSGLAHLAMLAENCGEALLRGERALELATRVGDDNTRGLQLQSGQVDIIDAVPPIQVRPVSAAGQTIHKVEGTAILRYTLNEMVKPLDEANVDRFAQMVREMSATTQFIVITHSKRTMETASQVHGVTMEEPGISQIGSVRLT